VRHVADVVVVDVHGKATIGRANDLLDNQLRQLIDEGNDKILLNLADVHKWIPRASAALCGHSNLSSIVVRV
jgi:hypothetical protein